jgi:glycosyltransferase involved in cell wall biosynthesis
MSQNMLVFQDGERQRYGWSRARLRVELIRRAQIRTLSSADGLVFPTGTGRRLALEVVTPRTENIATIPPGVGDRFRLEPRRQRPIEEHTATSPFTWLYVSRIEPYKHQWNVVGAVGMLRREGLPVELELVGTGTGRARRRLDEAMTRWDPHSEYIKDLGTVADTAPHYHSADGAIFASSCDTPGLTLLETMAAGLPIACSNRSAMPELLGEAGEYFDPEDARSIAAALRRLLASPARRFELASRAFEQSQGHTWSRCATETLQLVARVARSHRA